MMEPRRRTIWLTSKHYSCAFLGGTPEFDLWYFGGGTHVTSALRLVDNTDEWDEWPVDKLPPKGKGYFRDITLTPEQEESIETYLRCFAPWVLASRSEEQT